MAERAGLWRHADFLRLWSAQAVSAFGSRITRTALPIIAVKTLGEPESIIALLTALQIAPGVVLALFAGGFVDRGRKRRILIAADLSRALLVGSLTLAWAVGALAMAQVIVVGALVGAASALFQITDVAFLPTLIGKAELADGNAKLEATEAIAEITGPASAGVLIAGLGAPLAVAIDAASYVWSALMLGRIRAVEARAPTTVEARELASPADALDAAPPTTVEAGELASPADALDAAPPTAGRRGEDLRIGMRAVFGHPLVRPIVVAHMVWSISGGFFMALYTVFCLRDLGLSESAFGVVIAMGGIGSLAGALLSRALVRAIGLGPALIATSTASLACALFIPLASGSRFTVFGFLAAHQLLSDGFAVAFIIQAVTLRQTVLPRAVLGRANAAVHVCTSGVLPIAALLAGAIAELASIRVAVWLGVLVGLLAPLFLLPLRHLRTMPSE